MFLLAAKIVVSPIRKNPVVVAPVEQCCAINTWLAALQLAPAFVANEVTITVGTLLYGRLNVTV